MAANPTWHGFNHTREQVPILVFGDRMTPGPIGRRNTFADVGATLLSHLNLPSLPKGAVF
jgi:phosphopentomutase